MKHSAVFLDKDGTLVEDVPYNVDPAQLRFTRGALVALRRLQARGHALFIVTNQPGLALDRFDAPAWQQLEAALHTRLREAGIRLGGVYHCPHAPGAGCDCRKPGAGLLRQAAQDHDIDLAASWMVGDILDDIEAGHRAGCRSILLDVGHETLWQPGPYREPVARVKDLLAAAHFIETHHPTPAWQHVERVLAIRLDNLGDVLMTTPALQAIKDSVPGAHVTLLASPAGAALAPHLPAVDDVIAWSAPWVQHPAAGAEPAALLGHAELAMVSALAQRRFDAAVIFTVCTQSALPAALLCRLAGIPLRLAHCRENPYGLLTDWVRDTEVPHPGMRHEVERQLDLVGHVGWQARSDRLSLHYEARHAQQLGHKLAAAGGAPDRPYLVVHPGATAASRRWAPARFGTAADALAQATGCQVVWCGSADEQPLVDEARAVMEQPGLSLVGQLSLGELAALIGGAQLTLCNNSAASHIAAALDRPAVVLYALTNPQHTPWRNPARVLHQEVPCRDCLQSRCPQPDHPCLSGVMPQAVVDAALSLLGPPPAVPVSRPIPLPQYAS